MECVIAVYHNSTLIHKNLLQHTRQGRNIGNDNRLGDKHVDNCVIYHK